MFRRSRPFTLAAVPAAIAALSLAAWQSAPVARAAGELRQEAYVWQRAWTPAVSGAAAAAASDGRFARLAVLVGEISFAANQRPQTIRVRPSYECFVCDRSGSGVSPLSSPPPEPGRLCHPPALVIRVGPYSGPFGPDAPASRAVVELARQALAEARAAGVSVAELQVDFDCPESRLDGYARWLAVLRPAAAPACLTFTALPCWLDRSAFALLAAAADGFVLQVHSLHRPRGGNVVLCDAAEARSAVERAAAFGRPFRVALPTYGYLVAFDGGGRLIGLSAEGAAPSWPRGTRVELAAAEPDAMARLVRGWTADRPAAMRGVIWYRLPVAGDRLNWSAETLAAVMAGGVPAAALEARARAAEPGLVEVTLANAGSADARGAVTVRLRWSGPAAEAADGLAGFRVASAGEGELRFVGRVGPDAWPMRPGQQRNIGWIRLGRDREIVANVDFASKP
jgi:hypothetical protein